MSLPTITAVYRLAQPPKLRAVTLAHDRPNVPLLQLRLAASSSRLNPHTREWETTGRLFIDAELLDHGAAEVYPLLSTGSPVAVTGQLVTDEWTTESGERRSRIKLRARAVHPVVSVGPSTEAKS
ncbi:single-stranded DNA-binding protein [Tsukamurella tyrosinosolvens]|uniref:single-stranded DNA-binding protein n=1 Tax=Tsukamurella tyrosinosolvens TaxID=57704 RepID=UPI001AF45ABA|nr:single-stranded DNA-binding protein [Tsukamurella tyrosinosolvens]QRY85745.1 single-stranded DNA-binding protein [Tsukamurella tyrosinosolvens]